MPGSVINTAEAIRERHRAAVRRRALRIGVATLVVLLVGAVVWAIWFSPWFVATSVRVTGTIEVPQEEIVAAASVEIGTPLARLDVDAIQARVAALPGVEQVEITREWSGVVLIAVTERTAVYTSPLGNQFLLVDGAGVGYLTVPERRPELPLVNLPDAQSPSRPRLMADAAVIVGALPPFVREQMVSISAETADTFTITVLSGAQILWGSAEESDLKASVIDSLLRTPASFYDISSPTRPATR